MTLNLRTIDCSRDDASALLAALRGKLSTQGNVVSEAGRKRTIELFGEPLSPQQVVERICADVRTRGLPAVLELTAKLDRRVLTPQAMRVTAEELAAAHRQADPAYLATIRRIRDNIVDFQQSILHSDVRLVKESEGRRIELRQRYRPLRRVGLCVPGGAAAYPSTVLMTAVPAQEAGVKEIAVVVPPTDFGGYNVDLLACCAELGITEIYRIGGAQAVAALAYGVEGIERVDKIVGPGNLFVALAKRHVYGEVDIDSIAGPSEVIVLADATANAAFVAADLISQAEHSPGSGVLITWHAPLIAAVKTELEMQLSGSASQSTQGAALSTLGAEGRADRFSTQGAQGCTLGATYARGDLARQSLEDYGALILARDESEAARLTDELAPEHLHLSMADPEPMLDRIQNAGAIFLGHHTPVALGDYVAGPSHVLPTGGTARFANGLCANDFLKRSSVIGYNREALAHAAEDVRRMAAVEGLTAHSASVDIRLP